MSCTICFNTLKEPAVLPCGHIFCEKCIKGVIKVCGDEYSCPCPVCRTLFNTVIPDLAIVPQKYHKFLGSAIRRIYPDADSSCAESSSAEQLRERVSELETTVAQLKAEKAGWENRTQRQVTEERARAVELQHRLAQTANELNQLKASQVQTASGSRPTVPLKRTADDVHPMQANNVMHRRYHAQQSANQFATNLLHQMIAPQNHMPYPYHLAPQMQHPAHAPVMQNYAMVPAERNAAGPSGLHHPQQHIQNNQAMDARAMHMPPTGYAPQGHAHAQQAQPGPIDATVGHDMEAFFNF